MQQVQGITDVYMNFVEKLEWKRPLEDPGVDWGTIKMDLQEAGWRG